MKLALEYPNNLRIWHYLRYLAAPTCCYQLTYPTSPRIRWGHVFKHFIEFALCNILVLYILTQHVMK